jgi:MFS family permease
VVEARSPAPLIPLRFFANRTRVVANFAALLFSSAFFTYFFLMTLFQQQVLGYSPLRGGLSYLPFGIGIGAGIDVSTALMPRLGVKPLLCVGFLGAAAGLLMTSWIHVGTSYAGGVLPGMIVLGVFSGLTFPAGVNAALHQVTGQDSSLASGVQSATQAIGGALGLAFMVTLALRHAAGQIRHGVLPGVAATHGYVLSFRIGAALLAAGGVFVLVLLEHVTAQPHSPVAELSPDPVLRSHPDGDRAEPGRRRSRQESGSWG